MKDDKPNITKGKSWIVEVGWLFSQHTIAISLQFALLALHLISGTIFEERVEGWLIDSMEKYRGNKRTTRDSFQREFECIEIIVTRSGDLLQD